MQFVYPYFLFAISSIAIPIIIHLFNFRRYKKVHFSNVSFLQALQLETRKRSRIRQWLILAARILALTCLAIAFAQPFIPGKDQNTRIKGDKAISIFIDNSFSMHAQGTDGQLETMAIDLAREIIRSASGTDKIQLLTQDFEGRHQILYTPEEALQLLDEIKTSSSTHNLSDIIQRQRDILEKAEAPVKRGYIISDFQTALSDFKDIKSDSTSYFQLIPLTPNTNSNLYIDSCWLSSPELAMNAPIILNVRITNKSAIELKDQVLNYEINGETKLPVSYSVAANSSVDVQVNFTIRKPGYQWGKILINDSEINFDDEFYFSLFLPEQLNILHIKERTATNYIDKLFQNDSYFKITHQGAGQVDFSVFNNTHIIILDELNEISNGLATELKKFTDRGGSVFMIPGTNMNNESYAGYLNQCHIPGFGKVDTTNTKLARIDQNEPYFKDVFESIPDNMEVPLIKSQYTILSGTSGNDEIILTTTSGNKFFIRNKCGKGSIYQLSVPLQESFSNFAKNILFVPVVIKAALQSVRSGELYYTISKDNFTEISTREMDEDRVLKVQSLDGKTEFIPEQKTTNNATILYFNNQVKEAGIYKILQADVQVGQLAFNYSRLESDPKTLKGEEIQQQLNELGISRIGLMNADKDVIKKQINELDQGIRLWKLFIILVLVFIACEILLARFMK